MQYHWLKTFFQMNVIKTVNKYCAKASTYCMNYMNLDNYCKALNSVPVCSPGQPGEEAPLNLAILVSVQ